MLNLKAVKRCPYWLLLFVLILGWIPCTLAEHQIDTTVGNGNEGNSDGEGPIRQMIVGGRGIAVDSNGHFLYIADTENHVVRKVHVETGQATIVAGCRDCQNDKIDGKQLATSVALKAPIGVAIDKDDNLYILDQRHYYVFKVDTDGIITKFAGTGKSGYEKNDKGQLATEVKIRPYLGNISLDSKGNLYIVERINHCIRVVKEGKMTTVAGTCDQHGQSKTQLNSPADVKIDKAGNLYIADTGNHVIRKLDVNKKTLVTIAGTIGESGYSGDNGKAIEAKLNKPSGIALDKQGHLYIADSENYRIRKVDKKGIITTLLPDEATDKADDLANKSLLYKPEKLVFDLKGLLYISSKFNVYIVDMGRTEWISLLFLFVLLVLLGICIIFYYLYFYHHPIVQSLSADTSQLLKVPFTQLSQAKYLLKRTHRLDTVLKDNEIHITCLDEAIRFMTMSNTERCALLADRVVATVQQHTDNPDIFKFELDKAFPLNLTHCQLYLPPVNLPAAKVITKLSKAFMKNEVIVVIHLELTQQNLLRNLLRSKGKPSEKRWIIPHSQELTEWLLSPKSIEVFAHLLASQLTVMTISPYQTGGGIENDTVFFGRGSILTQIFDRELKNYIIVGGRQMGKSSLLKKIERYYQKHDATVKCFYLSLGDDNLQKLNLALGLAKNAPLSALLDTLSEISDGEPYLILIDEADKFISREIAAGYPILRKFRSVSEEGRCHFILAGFWSLYEAIALDYHSPLVNFGESIRVAALEEEACQELITEPMAVLGIQYEKDAKEELIQQIITTTGQRPNLISIVCNQMLKNLSNNQRILSAHDVKKALNSKAVEDALADWTKIFKDEQTARLGRIVVYATIEKGKFTLKDVMNMLNEHEYVYTAEQLTQLLKRLELAYIIQCEKGRYSYCVPLFREMLLENDMAVLLEQEFKDGQNFS